MPPPAEGFAPRLLLGPALRAQPDRRLVALVQEGYEVAFEEIVRRYAKPLGSYAAAIVGAPRAEDVTQDAFYKALRVLRRGDDEIDLRPWLYRIVRNTALNDLRDRPPEAEALAEQIVAGRTPAEEAEQRDELTDLMRRLAALPDAQRAAIVMRELEGLSHEEIAQALGLSGGAVRQSIHRARQALRDGLGLLLPLPLLRFLGEHGAEASLAGAGAAAAAGASAGGAGLVGGALKVGIVAAVLAGSVGAGVALREDRGERSGAENAAAVAPHATRGGSETATAAARNPAARREAVAAPGARNARGRGEGGSALGDGQPRGRPEPRGDHGGGDPGPESHEVGTGDDGPAPESERAGARRGGEAGWTAGNRGEEGRERGRGAGPHGPGRGNHGGGSDDRGAARGSPGRPADPGGNDRPEAGAPDRGGRPDQHPAGAEAAPRETPAPPANATGAPANGGGSSRGAGNAENPGGPDAGPDRPEAGPDAGIRGKGGRKDDPA